MGTDRVVHRGTAADLYHPSAEDTYHLTPIPQRADYLNYQHPAAGRPFVKAVNISVLGLLYSNTCHNAPVDILKLKERSKHKSQEAGIRMLAVLLLSDF